MRVFVSSVIKGFEEFRDAAASAIRTLGHVPVLAEELGASPDSPQQACLGGVRDADSFVLVLGDRYGHPQASGLSATHEEYREARDTRPVLVFLRRNVEPEPLQLSFINEVRSWEQGHLTADFGDPSDLRDKVTRELHDYELANEAAPLDESELATRAHALIPTGQSSLGSSLVLAVTITVDAIRALVLGHGPTLTPTLQSLAWSVAIIAVFAPLAVSRYRKAA